MKHTEIHTETVETVETSYENHENHNESMMKHKSRQVECSDADQRANPQIESDKDPTKRLGSYRPFDQKIRLTAPKAARQLLRQPERALPA